MQLKAVKDAGELARTVARRVIEAVAIKPDLTLLAATGNTPLGAYAELAAAHKRGEFDSSRMRVLQLDEYLGLEPGDARSLYGWMDRALLQPLGIAPDRVLQLDGNTTDPVATCRAYDAAVKALGGIDMALLGLGPNGHLGFNEPPSDAVAPTRSVRLTEASMVSNAAYWGGRHNVPPDALTVGMASILGAREVLLVVSGQSKRGILEQVLKGSVTPDVPASLLRNCAQATIIADEQAMTGADHAK